MTGHIRVWIGVGACAVAFWLVFMISIFPRPAPFEEQLEAFGKISGSDDLWHKGVRYHEVNEYGRAMEAYDKSLELNPESTFALLFRGRLKYDLGDYDGAASDFTTALAIDPQFGSAINARIAARYRAGDRKGAQSDVERFIENDSGLNIALINRGVMKRLDGDLEGARAEFDQLKADTPKGERASKRLLENIGALKFQEGDFEGALRDFSELIERDPYSYRFYSARAEIYLSLNRPDEAAADREKYREIVREYNALVRKLMKELGLDLKPPG